MSFGPKLDVLPAVVAAHSTITATFQFTPNDTTFERETEIYVEDLGGLTVLKMRARSAP